MRTGKKRVYVDTSVVLGKFDVDESRRRDTELFWHAVRSGEIVAIASDVLRRELREDNVDRALRFLTALPRNQIEIITITDEAKELAERYIAEKVVGSGSRNDCRHVALATIHADGIVSWNLGDMVKRADKYNSVNVTQGYNETKIVTPNKYKEIYK
jgi:predicted nucleic acid-binding protein